MSLKSAAIKFITGLLVVYAMYYAGFGWLPVSFIENRTLKYIVNTQPFLGYLPFDFIVIVVSSLVTGYALKLGMKYPFTSIVVAFTGYLLYALLGYPPILSLFSASAIITLYTLYKHLGLREVIIPSAYLIILFEVAVVTSTMSYFAMGSWTLISKAIILRERFMWGFMEWVSIPLLAISALFWTYSYLGGREFPLKEVAENVLDELRNGRFKLSSKIALSMSVGLVLLAVTLPHLPTVDPGHYPVSVDTFYYMKFLKYANSHGLFFALLKFKGFARPAYLVLLYYVCKLIDPVLLLDLIHPAVALTLLTITTYLFVRRFAGENGGSIAALLAPLGHSAVTFISGGFQANSVALPLAILMLSTSPKSRARLLLLSLLVSLIHPWTFIMFSVAYIAYAWRIEKLRFRELVEPSIILSIALCASEVVDLITANVSPSATASATLANSLGFYLPKSLFRGIEFWTWGSQSNSLVYIISSLTPIITPVSALLAVAAPLLLFTPSVIIHRLLLNIPLEAHLSPFIERMDKAVITVVILATIARGLEVLAGMTPLTGNIWQAILYRP